jgi:hypothetical protein
MSSLSSLRSSLWMTGTRYYRLRVQQDLFGEWELLKVWRGRDSRRGRLQVLPAVHEEQAQVMFERESRRRARRGYVYVSESTPTLDGLDRRKTPSRPPPLAACLSSPPKPCVEPSRAHGPRTWPRRRHCELRSSSSSPT